MISGAMCLGGTTKPAAQESAGDAPASPTVLANILMGGTVAGPPFIGNAGDGTLGGTHCLDWRPGVLNSRSAEWNQLDEASTRLERGIALCKPWGNRDLLAIALAVKARLGVVRGDADQVREDTEEAYQLVRDYRLAPTHSNWVKAALARLWLAQGEVSRVVGLVAESGITHAAEVPYLREPELITLIRLRLAQADADTALRLVRQLLPQAEAARRNGRILELQVLQAMTLQAQGETDPALACLGTALALARPEGYVRSFLDEGEGLPGCSIRRRRGRVRPQSCWSRRDGPGPGAAC
jgi:hypothetical protein